jgi:tetratricopeptide (TPR) repeat protein
VGDTLYKQSKYQDAVKLYEKSVAPGKGAIEQGVFYNIGNAKYRMGKASQDVNQMQEAVACYKRALELDSDDVDAKYNLEFVKKEMEKLKQEKKEQEQQKQQDKEKKEKQEQQRKDQEQKKKEEQEKEQKEQGKEEEADEKKPQEDQEKEKQEKKEQKPQEKKEEKGEQAEPREAGEAKPMEGELTKEQAEKLLNALGREEKDPAQFIKSQIGEQRMKVDKDW